MKVAIVGMSPSQSLVPWNDQEWQKWCVAHDPMAMRADRTFEMHTEWAEFGPKYAERLSQLPNLYTQAKDLPGTQYPIEEVSELCGAYFESSIAYMFALAMYEGAEEIALFGVDMASEEEHGYQKPNMEYLIGLARGKGFKVTLLPDCKLLKPSCRFGYAGRYGWRA